jgi:iron complex outermembrane receptor protein
LWIVPPSADPPYDPDHGPSAASCDDGTDMTPMHKSVVYLLLAILATLRVCSGARAETRPLPSEHDFLDELPLVLSASRLQQTLADAPGAVTVIDRELIKASGARELPDLFRLVPGFQVGMAYNANPVVAYHGLTDQYSRHMQVLIDGRSAYSPYYLGSIPWNTLRLSLDDIERIEVLRGSNSAAYGANAFMGVINIVTRHPSQSQGAHLSTTLGNQGVSDQLLRYGGKLGAMDYRITAGRRSDDGFANFHDSRQTDYVAFRGDLRLTSQDELQLHLDAGNNATGKGFVGRSADPIRTQHENGYTVQAVWKRALGPDEELSLNAYSMRDEGEERFTASDTLTIPPLPPFRLTAQVDAERKTARDHLELQHIFRLDPSARVVWGMEHRREAVTSPLLFNTPKRQSVSLQRLFGNLEWRLAPQWLLNAGAMLERHGFAGTDLAPRLMLNFQPLPGQTLRLGTTTAYRTPSLAEERANVVYRATLTPAPPPPLPSSIARTTYLALGGLKPERIRSGELSYLGEFPDLGMSVDARLFREHVSRFIDTKRLALPPDRPETFLNRWDALVRGHEYQLRWQPSRQTLLLLNHARVRIDAEDEALANSAPAHSTTLFLSQQLPYALRLSLAHHWIGKYRWLGWSDPLPAQRRLDLRLGMPFRSGSLQGEFALVVQNAGDPYSEVRADYLFRRRTFAVLSLAF